jgi:hypothetical protein
MINDLGVAGISLQPLGRLLRRWIHTSVLLNMGNGSLTLLVVFSLLLFGQVPGFGECVTSTIF